MRYLHVTAQDRLGNGKADTVLLHFLEKLEGAVIISNTAFALDINGDGKVEFKIGDVTNNGRENKVDELLLERFANAYLQLNWFNPGAGRQRYLKIHAEDFYNDGSPDTVRLNLHDGPAEDARTQVSWHVAYDLDNNGKLEWNIHHDINQDGVIDRVDDRLVQRMAELFLKFRWK